jgi:holo-[acyl-carrier protein] synthase
MIRGVGIDLLETERLARALSGHGDRFEQRVFTEVERSQCRDRKDRIQALTARFAAKEACLKALGTGWAHGLSFRQIEVVRLPGGKPELRLSGAAAERARALGVTSIQVSLTHQPGAAAAVVVLEGDPGS